MSEAEPTPEPKDNGDHLEKSPSSTDAQSWGKPVENKELGVSYREKTIKLPDHRQAETGITSIRRRTVEVVPEYFGKDFPPPYGADERLEGLDIERATECLRWLTKGRFPSNQTWSHDFGGDRPTSEDMQHDIEELKKGGLYFQKIRVLNRDRKGTQGLGDFYHKEFEEGKSSLSLSAELDDGHSYRNAWLTGEPTFVFGSHNKAFVEYIDAILSNPETIEMLENTSWDFEPPLRITPVTDRNVDELRKQIADHYLSKVEPRSREARVDWIESKASELIQSGVHCVETDLRDRQKHVDYLRALVEDRPLVVPSWRIGRYDHGYIPVIEHPDIRPLRWCHSEVAIMTTQNKSLNVLFFESD